MAHLGLSEKLDQNIPISDFYSGKSIFITGGTGFIGKVLLEKLLYNFPSIDKIYILMREKKGENVQHRLQCLTQNPLFTRILEKRPENLKKLVPIIGDVTKPNLGINLDDEKILIEQVSLVIHSAATIKFNEPLPIALDVNVEGTRKVLNLAQRMKNIQVFVNISTAYSYTVNQEIKEKVYPTPITLEDLYKCLEEYSPEEVQSSDILGDTPNTYTFTKALAENLVVENHGKIPTVIIRPSIVTCIKNEPLRGWLDNWSGAAGILTGITKGFLHVLPGKSQNIVDFIPVDYVCNLIIIAAAKGCRSDKVIVYNSCSSSSNPITLKKIIKLYTCENFNHGYYVLPFPTVMIVQWKWLVALLSFVMQTIPAYAADFWCRIRGIQPRYVKLLSIFVQVRSALEYFTRHSWVIQSHNSRALYETLSPSDKLLFPCDPSDIDWAKYIATYYLGIQRYLIDKK